MSILITGGAGYIGSHVTRQLSEANEDVLILDNLSTGFSDSLLYNERLIIGDVGDEDLLTKIFSEYKPENKSENRPENRPENKIDTVIHFAASIVVPESVSDPLKYYKNNSVNTLTLIEKCVQNRVKNFIFSSTAAVYGMPDQGIASENSILKPVNPYGNSKLMTELLLRDVSHAHGLNYVALRYFNAAGADPQARMGQRTPKATHLIKIACETAVGKRGEMEVFGKDYPTPDGTCLRDYIHIEDLAAAHLLALKYLRDGGRSTEVNAGYGRATSVLEVIKATEKICGKKLNVKFSQNRPGDPPKLIAESKKIRELFGWTPKFDDLSQIVSHAYAWEKRLAGL
jgi:UDP-glucose 4-epimerase